jgi:hypothetical protein
MVAWNSSTVRIEIGDGHWLRGMMASGKKERCQQNSRNAQMREAIAAMFGAAQRTTCRLDSDG